MSYEPRPRSDEPFFGWATTLTPIAGGGAMENRVLLTCAARHWAAAEVEFLSRIKDANVVCIEVIPEADFFGWVSKQPKRERECLARAFREWAERVRDSMPAHRWPIPANGGSWKVIERTRAIHGTDGRISMMVKERLQ